MGVVATIPEKFLDRNLRMSDFAFLDGFEGYDSELPIASLGSSGALGESNWIARRWRMSNCFHRGAGGEARESLPAEGRQDCETDRDNLIFLILLCAGPIPRSAGPPSRRITRGTADQDPA